LERLGYEVTTRTSSIEALELFKAKPDRFDLVITDMTMPHMTGDRLARELMKIRPDIPIILCTGFSERISEEKAKGMGIKAFVMKPLVMRDLANTVRKVLDNK
ncbi:MAG: response regulator, partial [Deltaproteobacteria bacterium]|nr:response regulator [Deltaproteobacteria bacterium]